jgi:hypothetical protein
VGDVGFPYNPGASLWCLFHSPIDALKPRRHMDHWNCAASLIDTVFDIRALHENRTLGTVSQFCEIWDFHGVTMQNVVFCDIRTQFVLHRRHITSPLQSLAG